ncbi:MAG: hypothetical protein HC810_02675, partial [Acaryochloridaceae cyanobacterium RL_2_7]|nr:hypothetical protein [Acaryochloridaceae cyanobacterium RL_2_7]
LKEETKNTENIRSCEIVVERIDQGRVDGRLPMPQRDDPLVSCTQILPEKKRSDNSEKLESTPKFSQEIKKEIDDDLEQQVIDAIAPCPF